MHMKKHKDTLRELAKFVSGLVLGDLMALVWLWAGDKLPMDLFGVTFTEQAAGVAIVFDLVILFLFIYYGWHRHAQSRSDKEYWFHYILGVVLAIVALVHLSRSLFGYELVLGTWIVPLWMSAVGAVITGFLAYMSFALAKK